MDDELFGIPSLVPVFPLPGVVLFPHTIIPLHLFEPRYRAMMADALAGARVIAVALLKPGWEPLYHTRRAPIHRTIGVGRIMESEKLADGNYNLLLQGVARAVVVEELVGRPYRLARVEPVETYCSAPEAEAQQLCAKLFAAIRGSRALDRKLRARLLKLRAAGLGLDELSDLLAAGMPAEAELRQCLLNEPDASARGQIVLRQIHTLEEIARSQRRAGLPKDHNLN